MKKMLSIIAVLALLTVACNQTQPTEEQITTDSTEMVVDTTAPAIDSIIIAE